MFILIQERESYAFQSVDNDSSGNDKDLMVKVARLSEVPLNLACSHHIQGFRNSERHGAVQA